MRLLFKLLNAVYKRLFYVFGFVLTLIKVEVLLSEPGFEGLRDFLDVRCLYRPEIS